MKKIIFILSFITLLVCITTISHAGQTPRKRPHQDITNCNQIGKQKVKPFKHKTPRHSAWSYAS